ncbi:hypothetical protein ACVI1L_002375 [Bradyrhizobium sp. USDA 4516]
MSAWAASSSFVRLHAYLELSFTEFSYYFSITSMQDYRRCLARTKAALFRS